MLKYCLKNWELNKEELREHLENFNTVYQNWQDLIILTVKYIFPKNIKIINFVYLGYYYSSDDMIVILRDEDNHNIEKYYIGYVSFSNIEKTYEENKNINTLMKIAYQFLQSIVQPYTNDKEIGEKA